MTLEQPRPALSAAEMYEHMLVTNVFNPLAESILKTATPKSGDRVVDVATGTGIVLRRIAESSGDGVQLAGVDMNPLMLSVGRSIAESNGISIDWHESDAAQLPFSDSSIDWVFCQHGLQFFPHKNEVLSEFRRILRDGGHAIISVWQGLEVHPFARFINEAGYEHAGKRILDTPFSLGSAETLHDLLREAGFSTVNVESTQVVSRFDDPETALRMTIAGGTAAIPEFQKLEDAERASLVEGVAARAWPKLDPYIIDGQLVIEWNANVAIAEK